MKMAHVWLISLVKVGGISLVMSCYVNVYQRATPKSWKPPGKISRFSTHGAPDLFVDPRQGCPEPPANLGGQDRHLPGLAEKGMSGVAFLADGHGFCISCTGLVEDGETWCKVVPAPVISWFRNHSMYGYIYHKP